MLLKQKNVGRCLINFFSNRVFLRCVNTNIWIFDTSIIDAAYATAYMHIL